MSSVSVSDEYLEIIGDLRGSLLLEKRRVLTLAALCKPIRNLSSVLGTYGQVGYIPSFHAAVAY